MVHSPSWEANWFAASQEIPRISRTPNVHYRTHKRLPPVSILGQPNPVHIPTSPLFVCCAMFLLETLPPPEIRVGGSSLPPDCFVSRASIPHVSVSYIIFLWGEVVSTSPNPQAGGPPLVGCPRLLIQYIRSYPPYRRPFLYSQPEDAPCRGDRDPLHVAT